MTSIYWFGFFERLQVTAAEIAQLTQDKLIHAMFIQASLPQQPTLMVAPPAPCEFIEILVLAGGSIKAQSFECLGHLFQIIPSGSVSYEPS